MIKYRINGKFISKGGNLQNICTEFFQNEENPFTARKIAINFLNNFIEVLLIDVELDFKNTFVEKRKLNFNGEISEIIFKYGIAVEFTIDGEEFYKIDYFGNYDNSLFDEVALGLETEYECYVEKNFQFDNSKVLTYCFLEEDESSRFKILQTSIDFSGKEETLWWLSEQEVRNLLEEIIERKKEEYQIEKAFEFGENNFTEFKPSLLYNFKTQQASIGVKNTIAKVICSFLNANGGKLLIGVSDSGKIQGLDYDFSLSNKENKFDFFRLEFDNLLYQFFDKNVFNYIRADFNTDYDKIFFEISVKPSDVPFFLLNKKENTKEFYIRTIASSQIINDIEEVVKYCLIHWSIKP